MKVKKVPQRRCTGCLQMKEKFLLIRVVKTDDGSVSVDLSGKMAGRGAYVCKNVDCLAKAEKNKGFERSFKSQISKDVYQKLKIELGENCG